MMPRPAATPTPTPCITCIGEPLADAEGVTVSFTDYESEYDYEYETYEKFNQPRKPGRPSRQRNRLTRPPRTEHDQAFKCVHCKQFIGAPISGGRHRNHCPNCLWSRHVDDTRPGDRKSDCHAAMEPVGKIVRRNGEQVLVHVCRGYGKEDPNRIAADDSPLLLMRLPLLPAIGTQMDAASEPDTA